MVHSITDDNLMGTSCMEQHKEMMLISNSSSSSISIYHTTSFDFIGSFQAHSSPVIHIASTGEYIWTLALSDIRVWRADGVYELQCLRTLTPSSARLRCLLSLPSHNLVLTSYLDGGIILWNGEELTPRQELFVAHDVSDDRGIREMCSDGEGHLWVFTLTTLSIYPNSSDLHAPRRFIPHFRSQQSSPSMPRPILGQPRDGRQTIISQSQRRPVPPPPSSNRPPPIRPPRPPERDQSSASAPKLSTSDGLVRRNTTTESPTPERRKNRLSACADALLSPRWQNAQIQKEEKGKSNHNILNSPKHVPPAPEHRRKKRKLPVYYEGEEISRVSRNASLTKLVSTLPDLNFRSVDHDHPVSFTISRDSNGQLQIVVDTPNGIPPKKGSSTNDILL